MTDFRKELVAPDGRPYVATSAREYNDLVFGGGYVDKAPEKAKPEPSRSKPPKSEEVM